MSTLNQIRESISEQNAALNKSGEDYRNQTKEVKESSDLTEGAKNRRVNELELERDREYKKLQEQKANIINNGIKSLGKRVYSGSEVSNPIAFDQAVQSFANSSDEDLIRMLKTDPSEETKRAIYKASVISDNPKFKGLAEASEVFPKDKEKISDYFELQQDFGKLEPRTQKLSRRLFGETA